LAAWLLYGLDRCRNAATESFSLGIRWVTLMATGLLKPSRIVAAGVVIAAVLWIGSGVFNNGSHAGEGSGGEPPAIPVQKVGVTPAVPQLHRRSVTLSCVTLADHKASATARGAGVLLGLAVNRGDVVKAGTVIGRISDEGRQAAVDQAQALLDQRQAEYDANKRLIDRGDQPRNNLAALEAGVAAAKAGLAAAQAEQDKVAIRAPIDGKVDRVPVQVGQAVQVGTEIAEIVDPDPMLAVGAVSEARRSSMKAGQEAIVRFIDNSTVKGKVTFVSLSADTATRTYRVETRMDNPDAAIPDGVTCEMAVEFGAVNAVAVPRSAIVFSDDGRLGVRIADAESRAQFVPVEVVDDATDVIWLTGIDKASRVIVVGQDFVKDGDLVQAVSAAAVEVKAEPPA
jgi:multidrug efflux system membrane fusion protein